MQTVRQRMVVIPSGFADMGRVIATVSRVADRGEQRRGWAKKKNSDDGWKKEQICQSEGSAGTRARKMR